MAVAVVAVNSKHAWGLLLDDVNVFHAEWDDESRSWRGAWGSCEVVAFAFFYCLLAWLPYQRDVPL